MPETLLSSYEEIPYESKPFFPTHPNSLATLATLMGMAAAPVDHCRLLELGCSTGGNLLPMAQTLPHSSFLGIDLSPRQIAVGEDIIARLGLSNISLKAMSILDVDDALGTFDYIVCHGVYSWVPPAVQDKILSICQRNLAPQGLAYVSYNTYPGWHLHGITREVMSYHVQRFPDPVVRIQQARAFLDFLISAVPAPETNYRNLLKDAAELLKKSPDHYLFHEYLEDLNQPVYFHQFMERAAQKNLQFVGEAWHHGRLENLTPEVRETLQALSENLLQLEQYIDFVNNRTFRRTVLCHSEVKLDRAPQPGTLFSIFATGLVRPQSDQTQLDEKVDEKFIGDDGGTATTNIPLFKAVLHVLYKCWPQSLPFAELWSTLARRFPGLDKFIPDMPKHGPALLADALVRLYLARLVALHIAPFDFDINPGERPLATPLARLQATSNAPVANMRHRVVELNDLDRALLAWLDGRNDRKALVQQLRDKVLKGELQISASGQALPQDEQFENVLREIVEASLGRLARLALIVKPGTA